MSCRNLCPACFADRVFCCFVKNGYNILRCKECGTMFVSAALDDDALSEIYSSADYYELPISSVLRIRKENKRRLRIIKKYKPRGLLLDIGCARGLLLDEAKEIGFETCGIELSPENVKICVENGHDVFKGYLGDYLPMAPNGGFDIITCLDVIEHVSDPLAFMLMATSMLKKDGVMVVTTPNYSGVVARILKSRDPYMTPPEHLNYFTSKGMCSLFHESNLTVDKKITFGRLVESELDRVVSKYAPDFLLPVEPFVKLLVPFGMRVLNFLKVGLEQEFYLFKKGE